MATQVTKTRPKSTGAFGEIPSAAPASSGSGASVWGDDVRYTPKLTGLTKSARPVTADVTLAVASPGQIDSQAAGIAIADEAPVWLDVDACEVWEGNPRHIIDPIQLDELAKLIAESGQQHPIDVAPKPGHPGRYLIMGGQRRWLAIKSLGLQGRRIKALVRPRVLTIEEMYAIAVSSQANTLPLKDIDFAISLAQSKEDVGVRALSRAINKSPGEVSKLRQIGELPTEVLEVLKSHAGKFSCNFAYEVVGVYNGLDAHRAIEFACEVANRDLTHKATMTRALELLGKRSKQTRSSWSNIRLSVGGRPAGSIRLREKTGDIALSLTGMTVAELKEIQEAVQAVVSRRRIDSEP